jgi:uncharacterized protein (DUF1501 family)
MSPTTRRAFLSKGLTMLAAGGTVPSFISKTAFAVGDPFDLKQTQADSGVDGKVLVVVQLSGGNDGLNTLIPWADDAYRASRPGLAIGGDDALKVNDYLGLHPALAPLKDLYDDGRMSAVQGVGYPNPNRSHFRSMDIWHTANPKEEAIRSGWLGRYFDSQCAGSGPNNQAAGLEDAAPVASDPKVGISIGETNRLAMQGEAVMPLSFDDVRDYQYKGPNPDAFAALHFDPDTNAAEATTEAGQLDFLTRTAMDAQVSSDKVLKAIDTHNPRADYPRGRFGEGLKMIAAMIRGNMPTRVYYVSLGGFDTHANQGGRHAQLMNQLAQGVSAFMTDMKDQGNNERVAMMTFSEFGRRVRQNASNGTDHGAAAPMFFFADRVNPGIHGMHPSLTDLDQGDLKYNLDFRRCYASVLHQWLDCDAQTVARVLGPGFNPLPLLRG